MGRLQGLLTIKTNPQSATPLTVDPSLPTAIIGVAYSGAIIASGGAGQRVINVTSKPAWMVLTSIGDGFYIASGVPTAGTSGLVTGSFTDFASTNTPFAFYVKVVSPNAPHPGVGLSTSSLQPPVAYTGGGYQYHFDLATLLTSPTLPLVSASVTTGSLPTGMSIVSNRYVDATNVTGATSAVVIHVTDTAGNAADLHLVFRVKPGLSIAPVLPPALVGHDYQGDLNVAGGSGRYSVQTSGNAVSTGLKVNPSSGKVTGRATTISAVAGQPSFTATVIDRESGQQITQAGLAVPVNASIRSAGAGFIPTGDGTGDSPPVDLLSIFFGDGSDGDLVLSGSVTASRDLYYHDLTIPSGASLNMMGFRLYVSGTLDLSACSANAIHVNGLQPLNTSQLNPGQPQQFATRGSLGGVSASGPGVAGGAVVGISVRGGGKSGAAGKGGRGTSLGANGGTVTVPSSGFQIQAFPRNILDADSVAIDGNPVSGIPGFAGGTLYVVNGGIGGPGGGSGGGTPSLPGGVGSPGGDGGGVLNIYARTILRSASTPAGAISANGGSAYTYVSPSGMDGGGTNLGGGGAGSGGGAGKIRIVAGNLAGAQAPLGAVRANGGAGGNAGVGGGGTGVDGVGGTGGDGGTIVLISIADGTTQVVIGGAATVATTRFGTAGVLARMAL